MSQDKTPETETELLRAILESFDAVESEASQDVQDIDETLRGVGLDPDDVARTMRAIAEQTMAASPFNWRNQTAQMKDAQDRLQARRAARPSDRAGLLAVLQKYLGQNSPQIQRVALAHRNLASLTDEDLVSLLDELEFLSDDDLPDQGV